MARDLPNKMSIKPRDMKRALRWARMENDPGRKMPEGFAPIIPARNRWKLTHVGK